MKDNGIIRSRRAHCTQMTICRGLILIGMSLAVAVLGQAPSPPAKTLQVAETDPPAAHALMEEAVGFDVGTKWALLVGINEYQTRCLVSGAPDEKT